MMDRIEAALLDANDTPVAVATALQSAVRAEDTVGRFGGDAFLVLAQMRDTAGTQAFARHMLNAVRSVANAGVTMNGVMAAVGASIGYALAAFDTRNPMNLLQLTDDALDAAKRLGNNGVCHCAPTSFEATRL
jgi:diguanylate cyclase (GGDEF)-like protein